MSLPVVRLKQSEPSPLYASRPVLNAAEIIEWASAQGFKSTLPAEDIHVTVAFSRNSVDVERVPLTAPELSAVGGVRIVSPLGVEGAVVLKFDCPELQVRWEQYIVAGASWDWDSYQPHITITYDGAGVDLSKVQPFLGAIVLGQESTQPLNLDKKDEYVEAPTSKAVGKVVRIKNA